MGKLMAGAGVSDITPKDTQYLFGYPHVRRYSTGVHDPLLSSALYMSDGPTRMMFIANDIIFVPRETSLRARRRIHEITGIPAENILVSATHTHSGPSTVDYISLESDPTVPRADPAYLQLFEDGIVAAALEACRRAEPARVGLSIADAAGIGTNRRNPHGPSDLEVPTLLVRAEAGGAPLACMIVCSMHPTVLREASTIVSGDFPAMARRYLQAALLGPDCPVLHHTGPAGNQSPRHVIHGNTVGEVQRLGEVLGRAVAGAIGRMEDAGPVDLEVRRRLVDLPRRALPPAEEAERKLVQAERRLAGLRASGARRQEVRGAEVDWFGAEETVALVRAFHEGRMDPVYRACLPAEVQILRVGPWSFVGWPGELFVDYALAVKARVPDTFVISLANGELQGYIVTEEAAREGGYESSCAVFAPESGQVLVQTTIELMGR